MAHGGTDDSPVNRGELNGSLQHIYSKRFDKRWCVLTVSP